MPATATNPPAKVGKLPTPSTQRPAPTPSPETAPAAPRSRARSTGVGDMSTPQGGVDMVKLAADYRKDAAAKREKTARREGGKPDLRTAPPARKGDFDGVSDAELSNPQYKRRGPVKGPQQRAEDPGDETDPPQEEAPRRGRVAPERQINDSDDDISTLVVEEHPADDGDPDEDALRNIEKLLAKEAPPASPGAPAQPGTAAPPKADDKSAPPDFVLDVDDFPDNELADADMNARLQKIPKAIRGAYERLSKENSSLKARLDRIEAKHQQIEEREADDAFDKWVSEQGLPIYGKGRLGDMNPKSLGAQARLALRARIEALDWERVQAQKLDGKAIIKSIAKSVSAEYTRKAEEARARAESMDRDEDTGRFRAAPKARASRPRGTSGRSGERSADPRTSTLRAGDRLVSELGLR